MHRFRHNPALSSRAIIVIGLLLVLLLRPGLAPAAPGPAARPDRLVVAGDTVYDRKTDLTWQRCAYGQRFVAGEGCHGVPVPVTFDEALALESGGWRVPTLDELSSIVVAGAPPTIDGVAFPNTPPAYFWATDNRDRSQAWYVYFENGRANHYFPPRTNRDALRWVRSGKPGR